MKKRVLALVLSIVLIINLSPDYAASPITVMVNNNLLQFDVQPTIENGRTLVPVRAIFEALGAKVEWSGSTKTITAVKGPRTVVIKIGSKDVTVNGIHKTLDVPAAILEGRTLVPLRFISESLGSIVSWDGATSTAKISDAGLKVSFIDVGQADSILIETPNGKSMLIDAANNDAGDKVVSYIKGEGMNKIDVLVGTYPYDDHIGGMDTVINSLEIGKVYMPKAADDNVASQDVLSAIQGRGLKIDTAKAGVNIDLDSDLKVNMLAPVGDTYRDLANYSAVIKLTYKNNSFLFAGDAKGLSESEMLAAGYDLKADVIKLGDHGSASSTTSDFLKAVSPKYAVISVGKGNEYGHPEVHTICQLDEANVQTFRTDRDGTIVASSDGEKIEFNKASTAMFSTPKSSARPAPTQYIARPTFPEIPHGFKINVNLTAEVVTIVNLTHSKVDMSGWKLVSVKGNQIYTFPKGFILESNRNVSITSGPKAYSNGTNVLKWTTENMWNNYGDKAELYDDEGNLVCSK